MNEIPRLHIRLRFYLSLAVVASAAALISLTVSRTGAHEGETHGPTFQVGQATDRVFIAVEAAAALGIRSARAEARAVAEVARLPGVVRAAPDREALVTSPVEGVIRTLRVRPGDIVRRGDVIAEIASAEVGRARGEASAAAGEVGAAEANLARQARLYERGIVSGREVEEARAALARAEGALSGAGASVAAAGGGVVRAPISGVVAERPATIGQAVGAGEVLAHIVDPSVVMVEGDVPAVQAGLLRPNAPLRVRTAVRPDRIFEGRVRFVSPVVEETRRTIHIMAEIANPETLLRPGMFVDVFLEVDSAPAAVAVPTGAIVEEGVERFVFVEQAPGEYSRVRVVPGVSDGFWVAITGPVFPGDKVVVEGGRTLEVAALTGSGRREAEAGAAPGAGAAAGDGHGHEH